MYLPILRVHFNKKDWRKTYQMMLVRCFFCGFSDFLHKNIGCWYSFEMHQQVDTIQMGTHNLFLYKEVDKNTLAVI